MPIINKELCVVIAAADLDVSNFKRDALAPLTRHIHGGSQACMHACRAHHMQHAARYSETVYCILYMQIVFLLNRKVRVWQMQRKDVRG